MTREVCPPWYVRPASGRGPTGHAIQQRPCILGGCWSACAGSRAMEQRMASRGNVVVGAGVLCAGRGVDLPRSLAPARSGDRVWLGRHRYARPDLEGMARELREGRFSLWNPWTRAAMRCTPIRSFCRYYPFAWALRGVGRCVRSIVVADPARGAGAPHRDRVCMQRVSAQPRLSLRASDESVRWGSWCRRRC